jgi:voltage-gated sodium channel
MFSNSFLTGSSDAAVDKREDFPQKLRHESGARRARTENGRGAKPGNRGGESEQAALLESLGYAKNMRNLREELTKEIGSLRSEVKDCLTACLTDTRTMVTEVVDNIRKVEEAQGGGMMREQCTIIREEMRSGLGHVIKLFEDQISENTSQVLSELGIMRERQEESEQVLHNEMNKVQAGSTSLENLVSRSAAQITELLNEQQATNSETFTEIRLVSQKGTSFSDSLTTNIDAKLHKHLKEDIVNVDLSQVIRCLETMSITHSEELRNVHAEIAKMQQEMNMDFSQDLLVKAIASASTSGNRRISGSALRQSIHAMKAEQLGLPGAIQETGVKQSIGERPPAIEAGDSEEAYDKRGSTQSAMHRQGTGTYGAKKSTTGAKRVRNYWCQTELEVEEKGMQTEVVQKNKKVKKASQGLQRDKSRLSQMPVTQRKPKPMVADAEQLKKKARENMMKPQYNVFDDYYETGCFQAIAKSHVFQDLTFFVIFLNAIWISVDLDNNDAATLTDADPIFQIAENAFCTFFTFEVIIRFGSFSKKRHFIRDWWLIFDLVLVFSMVLETWLIPGVMWAMGLSSSSELGPVSILRTMRMAKMARMARMVRLARYFPEILVLVKGIKSALRSVSVFFILWLIIIYVYAVVLRQVTEYESIGRKYFSSIPAGMNTLLMRLLLPAWADIMDEVNEEMPLIWPFLFSFILICCLTMMNMLIGVLVEVVTVLSAVEKESMAVSFTAQNLRAAMKTIDKDTERELSHAEFRHLLVQPEISSIIHNSGGDVVTLLDQSEVIFETIQTSDQMDMTFEQFIEVVLNMRNAQGATVKDIGLELRTLRKIIQETVISSEVNMMKGIGAEILKIRKELNTILEHMDRQESRKYQSESGDCSDGSEEDDDDARSMRSAGHVNFAEESRPISRSNSETQVED